MRLPLPSSRFLAALALAASCAGAAPTHTRAADGPVEPREGGMIDLPMHRDPVLAVPEPTYTFHPRLAEVWAMGLERPEVDERRLAAEAIGRAASMGMTGLDPLMDRLMALATDDRDPLVQTTCIAALAQIDDARAAEVMVGALGAQDPDRMRIADAALTRWLGRPETIARLRQPAIDAWIDRVGDAEASPSLRASAAEALGAVKAGQASEALLAVVDDSTLPRSLRLAAATAAGRAVTDAPMVATARALAESTDPDGALLAMRLITRDDSADAIRLAEALAVSGDAVVAPEALAHLVEVDAMRAVELRDRVKTDGRPNTRLQLVYAWAKTRSPDAPREMTAMLDDPSLAVRTRARDGLIALVADESHADTTRTAVLAALHDPAGWRQAEPAALVAGQGDIEAAADPLLALLSHDRAEVRLASADALRRLAEPQTLPRLLAHAQTLAGAWKAEAVKETPDAAALLGYEAELTQLHQAFGAMRYADASAHLNRFVAKSKVYTGPARGSAVYALGLIHEASGDAALAGRLAGRVRDLNLADPEIEEVRVFAAISLGRMKAEADLAMLRQFAEAEEMTRVGAACRWSIGRITGQAPPEPEPRSIRHRGWYLEPLDD